MLSDKARQSKNEYMRKYMRDWTKKNPEKVKESNRKYWEKRSERVQEETEKSE
jgi:hypothetical protein